MVKVIGSYFVILLSRMIHLEAMTDRDKPDQKHSVQWVPREANLA